MIKWQVNQFSRVDRFTKKKDFLPPNNSLSLASVSKVDERGRILIPVEIRNRFGFDLNREVVLFHDDEGVKIIPTNGIKKEKIFFESFKELVGFLSEVDDFLCFNVKKKKGNFVLEIFHKEVEQDE